MDKIQVVVQKDRQVFKLVPHFLMISLLAFHCAPSKAASIKIGIAGPFSGFETSAGDQLWFGASVAVDDINAQGGIDGNKLELITADDECQPTVAASVADRLIKEKVVAVIGHPCTSTTLAASKKYANANILMITPDSTEAKVTEQGSNSIFRTCGRSDNQSAVAADFIYNKLKAKKIAIIYSNSPYGASLSKQAKESLEKLRANIALFDHIKFGQTEYPALIEKINKVDPDVIYFVGFYADAGHFLKKLREQKNQSIFVSDDAIASSDFVLAAGGPNIVNDVYMTFFDPLSNPGAKKVIKEFEEKRITPDGYTLNSYAAVQVIAQAIKKSGSLNSEKLAQWLHHNKVDTVIGELEWDQKGDLINAPFVIYKWNDDGEYTRLR